MFSSQDQQPPGKTRLQAKAAPVNNILPLTEKKAAIKIQARNGHCCLQERRGINAHGMFFIHTKVRVVLPNWMNFRNNSKWPLTTPLTFGKLCCNFFMIDMVACMQGSMMAIKYEMHAHDFQSQGPFWGVGGWSQLPFSMKPHNPQLHGQLYHLDQSSYFLVLYLFQNA